MLMQKNECGKFESRRPLEKSERKSCSVYYLKPRWSIKPGARKLIAVAQLPNDNLQEEYMTFPQTGTRPYKGQRSF